MLNNVFYYDKLQVDNCTDNSSWGILLEEKPRMRNKTQQNKKNLNMHVV